MPPELFEDDAREAAKPLVGQRLGAVAQAPRRLWTWATSDWLRAGLVATAGLASIGAVVILWLALYGSRYAQPQVEPSEVLKALDRGQLPEARRLAAILYRQNDLPTESWGLAAYVLGVAAVAEAEQTFTSSKKDLYLLAARYLEEARDRGFPAGRGNKGLYLLGKSLYHSGQYAASRPILEEALKVNPEHQTEIHLLLAGACLHSPDPLLAQALEHNRQALADPNLPADWRRDALHRRAEILLHLEKPEEALDALAKAPDDVEDQAESMLLQGWARIEQAEALQKAKNREGSQAAALEEYRAAIQTLRQAIKRDTLAAQVSSQAMYLIGLALQQSGDREGALEQFYRTYSDYGETPEAVAANLRSAELHRQLGRHGDALTGYRRVLSSIKDPATHSNPWLPLGELRRRILEVYQYYSDHQHFAACLQLAGLLTPLFSQSRAVELKAETYQAWGRKLLAEAEPLPASRAAPMIRQGRQLLRAAGKTYAQLAELHVINREYPDDLWASAENYLHGHDFQAAVKVLREYIKNESRRRYPRALVNLGKALLAMGRTEEALEAFSECIRFHPRDAASFEARLMASRAYAEKGDRKQARAFLEANLNGDILAPSSEEWRDSLFALGRLLHGEGRYAEAIDRLEEAVARYPDCPHSVEARYLIAECYRRSARQLREQADGEAVASLRQAHARQIAERFESALKHYEQLESDLGERQRRHELNPLDRAILRNSCFSIGSVLFELGRYEAAVKAYAVACNRYQNEPEVLEAYVQLARAYRHLDKPNEARTALDQAKVALARMNPDGPFTETTNYTKEQWSELLDWMGRSYHAGL